MPRDTILLSLSASQENAKEYYRYIGESLKRLKSSELKQIMQQQRQQIEDYFHKLGFEYENDILPLVKETAFCFLGLEQVSLAPRIPAVQTPRIQPPSITFPFPRICLFVKVSDKKKADGLISEIMRSLVDEIQKEMQERTVYNSTSPQMTKPGETIVSIQEEMYNDVKITRLFNIIPLFPFLSPSYCFIDNYLIMGSNDIALRDVIDTYLGRRNSF
jgi:hypothetical protein